MNLKRIRPGWAVLVTVLVVALLATGVWWMLRPSAGYPQRIVIATGTEGGVWEKLGKELKEILTEHIPGLEVELRKPAGSETSAALLGFHEVQLAFVQNDTQGGTNLRTIAPLYEEFLQIVVRDTPETRFEDISELRGVVAAIGLSGSGTMSVSRAVLDHLALTDVVTEDEGAEKAVESFAEGHCHAVFVVAGLANEWVPELLRQDQARLLPLGDHRTEGSTIDGLCVSNPYFNRAVIPQRSFGTRPERPVGTISVTALLLCRDDLDRDLVRELTRLLFEHKDELARIQPEIARWSESFDPARLRYPMHEGAFAWYHRKDPSFFVRYADLMSLVLTILLAAGSALLAARQWVRRRQKNRIDVYYIQIEQIARRTPNATREELMDKQRQLERVRRHAFHDLVRERVLADESFRIFQAFLQAEFETIRSRVQDIDRRHAGQTEGGPVP